jgi:PqqD family protein of HPr-rel-A system
MVQTHGVARRKSSSCAITDLDNEVMLYDHASGRVFLLNETSRFIWEQCDGPASEDELARQVVERFVGVDLETARRDVGEILQQFESSGLLIQTEKNSSETP